MDYKNIIKSRSLRIKLMQMLSFIPDKWMIKLQYVIKTGRRLRLENPQRYTEKLQWYKLYYRDPVMKQCVDKYSVREFVKNKGLCDILTPIIGVYDKVDDIKFHSLPNKFVIKDTLGGGGTSVIIITDKDKVDEMEINRILHTWLNKKQGKHPGREWVYDEQRSRLLIENYIESSVNEGGLIDYKFFCFNGKVKYVYGIADRSLGDGASLGIFDKNFHMLPYTRCDEKKLSRSIKKPLNYDKMIEIAEKLSSSFPHARIDLYDQNEKIYFGEITFFDGSGYMKFDPDDFDFIMGKEFVLPPKNIN